MHRRVPHVIRVKRVHGQPRTDKTRDALESAHRQHLAHTDRDEDRDVHEGGNADGDAVQGGHTDGDNDPDGKWCVV